MSDPEQTGSDREPLPDTGIAATGFVCQNFPEHPGEEPEMVSAGPSPGVICPECGRMADGPDDEIPYGDPPHYGPESGDENRSCDPGTDRGDDRAE